MTQQSLAAESRAPNWIADLVVGGTAALLAVTVAQAAIPNTGERLPKLDLRPAAVTPQADPAEAATPAASSTAVVFGEPVPGYAVISPFGLRKLPWEEFGRMHQGVDIAAPAGLPVRAIQDGVVVRAGQDGGYGRFVEVQHANGLHSFYAHLGGFVAASRAGQAVKRGDPIGLVGSTGSSTGAHLHIEVRRDDRRLNPSYFIGKTYEDVEALPLRQASYIPRHVRIAYVSYIPRSKRERMEQREEGKELAALAAQEARNAKQLDIAEARQAALTKLQTAT
ncbi:MAG: M23 family metallopeptidase, partial [Phenylobacterium sp.]